MNAATAFSWMLFVVAMVLGFIAGIFHQPQMRDATILAAVFACFFGIHSQRRDE